MANNMRSLEELAQLYNSGKKAQVKQDAVKYDKLITTDEVISVSNNEIDSNYKTFENKIRTTFGKNDGNLDDLATYVYDVFAKQNDIATEYQSLKYQLCEALSLGHNTSNKKIIKAITDIIEASKNIDENLQILETAMDSETKAKSEE